MSLDIPEIRSLKPLSMLQISFVVIRKAVDQKFASTFVSSKILYIQPFWYRERRVGGAWLYRIKQKVNCMKLESWKLDIDIITFEIHFLI